MQKTIVLAASVAALLGTACRSKEPASGPAAPGQTGAPAPHGAQPAASQPPASHAAEPLPPGAVVLAELAAATDGPSPKAEQAAHPAGPVSGSDFTFAERGPGVAWPVVVGEEYAVVHNGRRGRPYALVGDIVLSRDGKRVAYGARVGDQWRVVVDGTEGPVYDDVGVPVFSPDGAHVAYAIRSKQAWRLVVDGALGPDTAEGYRLIAFSGDSSRVVFVEEGADHRPGRLVVCGLAFEGMTVVAPRAARVVLDQAGTRVAASVPDGSRWRVLSFAIARPGEVSRGRACDGIHDLRFGPDGALISYVADRQRTRYAVLGDREERLPAAGEPGEGYVQGLVARADRKGLAALVSAGGAVSLRQYIVHDGPSEPAYETAEFLTYSADGRAHAYAAAKGDHGFVVANGKEGPTFERVVSPLFSPDGRYLVYRARKDGRRFVVVADPDGNTLRQHRGYDQVFPVVFTADGKSVAYGVMDGRRLAWIVEPL